MIKLHDFSIGYGERTLLCEVETTIEKGRLTALIGRNGTGKSTLLRAIAGLNRRYTGRILLDGHNAADMRAAEMARTLALSAHASPISNARMSWLSAAHPIPTGLERCRRSTRRSSCGRSPRWAWRLMRSARWTRCRTASASAS